MTLCGIAFALFGGSIAGVFTDERGVIRVAKSLFLIAAVFQTLDAVNVILRGSLRGAKDVHWVAVVGTTVAWIAIPGSAFVLGRLAGYGAVGGWIGFVFETTAASILLWRRWSRGPWREAFEDGAARRRARARAEHLGPTSTPVPAG
jgi:MATE family multidrug resistance protein